MGEMFPWYFFCPSAIIHFPNLCEFNRTIHLQIAGWGFFKVFYRTLAEIENKASFLDVGNH